MLKLKRKFFLLKILKIIHASKYGSRYLCLINFIYCKSGGSGEGEGFHCALLCGVFVFGILCIGHAKVALPVSVKEKLFYRIC